MNFHSLLINFHFLRPWWFAAAAPALILVWMIHQRQDAARAWRGLVADHLLPFLLSDQVAKNRLGAAHLLGIGWLVTMIALAGPTWQQDPAPFAEDNAALAIVVKVTPSMKVEDIQPDRLSRSVQKIHDLLAIRRGAKTALIAYAGSAHVVMPITTDESIITTFAGALEPGIMPKEGDVPADALKLADKALAETGGGGSILWITDSVAPEANAALADWRHSSSTPIQVLAPLLPGPELDSIRSTAETVGARVIPLTPDDRDINEMARAAKYTTAPGIEEGSHWQDAGYWLTPLIALLTLPFFRRGWLIPTAAIS